MYLLMFRIRVMLP